MASNTIKGLTVEIGGDTTKLGKALKDVEAKSRSLSKELGDVNKLLKMDPGNADLLAQKQEILAKAVEACADKLDTLKQAEKQVQEQFKKGDVSEEQVRALQREIVATENKMKGYQKAIKETAAQSKDMADGTEEAAEGTKETGTESKKAADKVEDFTDAVDKAEKSGGSLGSTLGKATVAGFKAVGAAVGAAITGLVAAAESSREYRAEMGKLDAAFAASDLSAKSASATYSTLQGIIGETDQSVEAAQQIALLSDSEKDAAKWAKQAAGVVGKFGDALQPETFFESANETLKLGEATGAYTQMLEGCGLSVEEFNKGLAACSTEAEKQAYMLEVTESALGEAGDAYRKNNAEVIRANKANDSWMQSLAGIGGAIEPVITDIKLLGASLLADLVPGVESVAEAFRGMLDGQEGAASNLGAALSNMITDLLGKVAELAPLVVNVGMSIITTLTTTLISMLPQLLNTFVQLFVSAVDALTLAIPQITTAIVTAIPQLTQALVTGIPQMIQSAVQFFLAIMQAIPQIIPPLIAALPQIVTAIVTSLTAAIPQLLQGALTMLTALVQAIPQIIPPLVEALPQIVTAIVNCLIESIPILIQGALQLLDAIVQAVPQILPPLLGALPEIITTLINFLIDAIPQLVDGAIQLLNAIVDAIPQIIPAIIDALPQIISSLVSGLISAIPTLLEGSLKMFGAIIKAIPTIAKDALASMPQIIKAIVTGLGEGAASLGSKALELGGNIVEGLANGITNAKDWLISKIKGFCSSALDGIKSFFGINSPSRVMADEVGKWIPAGMAEGIIANTRSAVHAMAGMAGSAVDAARKELDNADLSAQISAQAVHGQEAERSIQQYNTARATEAAATSFSGLFTRLDNILKAIEAGQVLALDGDLLVGGTASLYDKALGQRRVLAARGAI